MFADKNALIFNKLVCSFLFLSIICPGVGICYFHCSGFANASRAKEERGISGNNLRIGLSAYIADFSLISCDCLCVDELVEFKTCNYAGKISCFVNSCKCGVVIVKLFDLSHLACCVKELNFGIFLSSFDYERLVAEAVCKDYVAAVFSKVYSVVIALC